MNVRIMGLAILVLSICLGAASAASGPNSDSNPPPKSLWDFAKELSLTQAQISRIREEARRADEETKAHASALQASEQGFAQLIVADAPEKKLRSHLKSHYRVMMERTIGEIMRARRISALLNPEQRAKWRQIQKREQSNR